VLDQFIKLATKAAFDHFFNRYTELGQHLSDNYGVYQIFTLIVGDEADPHVPLNQPFCQGCQRGCFTGTQKSAGEDKLYGFRD
jgi:hypothetical protein